MIVGTTDVIVLCSVALLLLATCVQSSPLVLFYRVEEDRQPGTVLADIKTDSRLSERYSSAVLDQLRFATLATQSAVDSQRHFHVDDVTGLIRAASSLDRDDICPAAVNCTLNIDLAVQPAAYFQLIKVDATFVVKHHTCSLLSNSLNSLKRY